MSKRPLILSCLLLITIAVQAAADSPVWRISKGDKHLYIGGTFHLLSSPDYPLPNAFTEAYRDAQTLVFETDLDKAQAPAFQMAMLKALTYQDGRTLQGALKPATYKSLQTFLAGRGIPVENFNKFTPGGVGLTIAVMEYQRLGMQPEYGVDYTYHQKAVTDKKPIASLETPEEQIAFIAGIGEDQGDQIVKYTLEEIEKLPEFVDSLKQAWRNGDLKQLDKLALADTRRLFPQTHKELIVDRNDAWLPRIKDMLADGGVEFVLVGALHLAGDEGVIAQLKKQGYKVKNL